MQSRRSANKLMRRRVNTTSRVGRKRSGQRAGRWSLASPSPFPGQLDRRRSHLQVETQPARLNLAALSRFHPNLSSCQHK